MNSLINNGPIMGLFRSERKEGGNKTDWLAKILGLCGDTLPHIRAEVGKMMQAEYDQWEESGEEKDVNLVAGRLCSKLIRQTAMKAGAMGAVTAAPAALPLIGTVGTAIGGTAADFTYLLRKQVWLCHAISAVYQGHIDTEELKAVTLALVGFSGTGQLGKEIATRTLKNIVDAAASRFLKRGIAESAPELAARLTPKVLGRSYKLIPFLSIPLSASINMASTMIVGNHARRYFGPADEGIRAVARAGSKTEELHTESITSKKK